MAQKLVVPITFKIFQGENLIRTETVAQSVIKIGRDQKAQLRIEDDSVSRMHAVIEAKPDDIQILDLGAGTHVNGQTINRCALKTGDEVRLGKIKIVVEIGQAQEAAAVTAPAATAPAPAPAETAPAPAATVAAPSIPPVAAAPMPSPAAQPVPTFTTPNPMSSPTPFSGGGIPFAPQAASDTPSVAGEEIYQLIKRGDINPHEVEESGSRAVEVSVLWKSSILHVAHLDGVGREFSLSTLQPKFERPPINPTIPVALSATPALLGVGLRFGAHAPLGLAGVAAGFVACGAAAAYAGLYQIEGKKMRNLRFVVGPEILQRAPTIPVVSQGTDGKARFLFLPESTGEVEIDGHKRPLQDLINAGDAQPSRKLGGAHEVVMLPNCRYRMEVGGLTVLAKIVPKGRKVAGATKRDPALIGTFGGTVVAVAAAVLAMRFATADDTGLLSGGADDDRLNDLRAFVQRQEERQQPEQQQQQQNEQESGGTGQRHQGEEGKMGSTKAPVRSARYEIRNNNMPPHLSRTQAREAVQNTGVFLALSAVGGGAMGSTGPTSPFSSLNTESGNGAVSVRGNMNGDSVGEAFGFNGLGAAGWGPGGGGNGDGTLGLGNSGGMGHGYGHGNGGGYGNGHGNLAIGAQTIPPRIRAEQPTRTGLLSPDAIRRVVLRNIGQVQRCHEQGLQQNPNLEGRVVVNFVIGPDGRVMNASPGSQSGNLVPSVASCIATAVRRWQFPQPEDNGVVNVNYPFTLTRQVGGDAH